MEPNPRKTDSIRRLGSVDVSELREAVRTIPEEIWLAEDADKPNRFATLDRTQHIVFRFVSSFRDWRESYERPLWSEWKGLLQPILDQATADYGYARGAFPRVMLARMAPGGVIKPHQDASLAARWPHKIHVPILTNDKVHFQVGPNIYHFPAGLAVEVNNMAIHGIQNGGETDRIHLIFEYYDRDQPCPLAKAEDEARLADER
jgi:hypothetical protein